MGSGKDQIDIYYFGRGHTDGDSFIVFPALRTMHVGDIFAWKALPYVDAEGFVTPKGNLQMAYDELKKK